ncbi:MAG: hypothetical protein GY754_35385, partial [bacterium]|nr:hypothetical protein [bacterium]
MEQKIKKKIKKKNSLILISAIILLSLVVPAAREEARARTKKINFVIIFPGGPSAGSQGKKIIKQFIDKLTAITGMPKSSLKGVYFNKISKAKRYVKRNKDSYIMGSLGFFLSMKNKLNLV